MSKHLRYCGVIAVAFFAILFVASLGVYVGSQKTASVQAAVITPIAQTGRGPEEARIAEWFVQRAITSDTRVCFDMAGYETIDLQYQVDATLANTTTVTLQQTNIDPESGPFNSAQVVATVISTDANVMSQVGAFGRWQCVFADVVNSNPITLTVIGVAK